MRYDAAIIGAGADGLTAASLLARAGLKTVVIERAMRCGGRLVLEEFHPGFRAAPFADRMAEIPAMVAQALALNCALPVTPLTDDIAGRRAGALAFLAQDARTPFGRGWLARLRRQMAPLPPPMPGADLATRRLKDWPQACETALAGRALDPALAGSALALLATANAGFPPGGPDGLIQALGTAAADAQVRLGLEASEVVIRNNRVAGLVLADGSRLDAAAVISTLDLKHSILSLFPWATLPPAMTGGAAAFRMGGGTARLLLALSAPRLSAPLLLPGDHTARAAFRRGAIPDNPPLLADPVSLADPGLCPPGAATLTVTLGCIPAQLFDGGWTHARRLHLAATALRRLEAVSPGLVASLRGLRIIAPPDIEERLGATQGDLDGGALAPDQMLAFRPGARTALPGFYLGGRSAAAGPLGTGAAGFIAALALLADRR